MCFNPSESARGGRWLPFPVTEGAGNGSLSERRRVLEKRRRGFGGSFLAHQIAQRRKTI